MTRYRILLVTAPDRKTARTLARGLLESRHAACVNLLPGVESHYWWQGRLESAPEILMVIKTAAGRVRPAREWILKHHPYDTPEFLVLEIAGGSDRYLKWLAGSLRP